MAAVRTSQSQGPQFVPGSVELKEWNRHGWTYHAKGMFTVFSLFRYNKANSVWEGIWLSPNPESPPILTLFGSTNLNSRSAHLDTELSFVMLANSDSVQKKLQLELQGLNDFAEDWKGDRRNVRAVTKCLVRFLSGYL
jgi:CDP-diacylglycerol---glycerol-3-phosphate 3-phosphatidyltransferase